MDKMEKLSPMLTAYCMGLNSRIGNSYQNFYEDNYKGYIKHFKNLHEGYHKTNKLLNYL